MWFFKIREQTNRQTIKHADMLIALLCTTTGGEKQCDNFHSVDLFGST